MNEISGTLTTLIWTVANKEKRAAAWKSAASAGQLFNGDQTIPDYDVEVMDGSRKNLCSLQGASDVRSERAYRFYQAAAIHRCYVLRELLPKHGVVVV